MVLREAQDGGQRVLERSREAQGRGKRVGRSGEADSGCKEAKDAAGDDGKGCGHFQGVDHAEPDDADGSRGLGEDRGAPAHTLAV